MANVPFPYVEGLAERAREQLRRNFDDLLGRHDFRAKGDLLLGSAKGRFARVPAGADRRVLVADSTQPGGVRWDWVKVGGENAHRIELHDHADPTDPESDDGFIHLHAPGQVFHGNIAQDSTGVAGTTRQSRVEIRPAQMSVGGFTPHLHLRSESADQTLPSDAHLEAGKITLESGAPVLGPIGRDPVSADDLARKAYVDARVGPNPGGDVPIGAIILWPEVSLPSPYLYCQGQAVSRTTYAALFAVIGIRYGAGDGSTTFNLPNFNDKFPQGPGALGLGATADKGSHIHNTQNSSDLNTGSLVGNSGLSGGFTHTHGANKTVEDGAFHTHSFGVGVNTFTTSANHTHIYDYGPNSFSNTGGQSADHVHSLQGIIGTYADVHHTHGINNTTVSNHNHDIGHNHNIGWHNHGSTVSGGVSLTAFGLYYAIRAS